ncbi:hypothetical protein [Acetobacter lambici]|uniref:hypothetical protein n=1 Tax=Acetobacter lambici TaxID=1332824 RepID=UPI00140BF3CF|nr:hypothetical protein [Acetobacter lambici]
MPIKSCFARMGTVEQADNASRQANALIRIILPFRKLAPEAASTRPPAPYERQQDHAEADKGTPGDGEKFVVGGHPMVWLYSASQ